MTARVSGCAARLVLGLGVILAGNGWAVQFDDFAMVSSTMGVQDRRVCVGEGTRGDIGCPAYAPVVAADGTVNATAFAGDGSGLTNLNLAGSVNDRITSGTAGVFVSNTGIINFRTANTTFGYFDGSGLLVAPGISITTLNGISSTNGYFSGKVAIGMPPSTEALEVSGNVSASLLTTGFANITNGIHVNTNTDNGNQIYFSNYNNNNNSWVIGQRAVSSSSVSSNLFVSFWNGTYWNETLNITSNSFVGINNNHPSATLHVAGTGYFTHGVRIADGSWPLPALHVGGSYLGGNITSMTIFSDTNVNNAIGYTNTAPVLGLVSWQGTGNYGNTLSFLQAGGNAEGDYTAVGANAKLGSLEFRGSNGSSFRTAASIAAFSDGTPGASWTPGKLTFSTTNSSGVSYERIHISSDGFVGIGIASPTVTLDVNGYIKLKKHTTMPVACSSTYDGSLAMTSARRLCVCDGADWKEVNSATACAW